MKCPSCDIVEKIGGVENIYFSNEHWIVMVRPKQVTLGATVLIS